MLSKEQIEYLSDFARRSSGRARDRAISALEANRKHAASGSSTSIPVSVGGISIPVPTSSSSTSGPPNSSSSTSTFTPASGAQSVPPGGPMAMSAEHSSTTIPPWMSKAAQEIYNASISATGEQFKGYDTERFGPRVAEFTPYQKDAMEYITKMLSINPNAYGMIQDLIQGSTRPFPSVYRDYMNPYEEDVLKNIERRSAKNFRENIMPVLENTFTQRGQHGSTRHADLAKKAAAEAQEAITAQQQAARAQHYQQAAQMAHADQMRALQGSQNMMDLLRSQQGQNALYGSAMLDIGNMERQREQDIANVNFQEYLRQLNYPREMIGFRSNVLHGLPYSTMSSGASMQGQPPIAQPGVAGQLGSTALSLLGARFLGGNR